VTCLALLFLLTSARGGAGCDASSEAQPTTLVIEVVDDQWFPLPGATVWATPRGQGVCLTGTANAEGMVNLAPNRGFYDLEVSLAGFKGKRVKRVWIAAYLGKSVQRVQIKLKIIVSTTAIEAS
jgi:hypothetical protein